MRVLRVVAIHVLLVASAGADELGRPDPAQSPGFVNMLRQDASSRAGGEISYIGIANEPNLTLLRFDFHGHYVDANSGLGGYAQLPITSATGTGDSVTAFGNL